jgi:hypothetical protein
MHNRTATLEMLPGKNNDYVLYRYIVAEKPEKYNPRIFSLQTRVPDLQKKTTEINIHKA